MERPVGSEALRGLVGVVTGGGRGIGAAVSQFAAAHGARVVVSDLGGSADGAGRDATAASECVAAISATGGAAVADDGDVTSYDDATRTIERAIDAFGRLDFVVHS